MVLKALGVICPTGPENAAGPGRDDAVLYGRQRTMTDQYVTVACIATVRMEECSHRNNNATN